MQKISVYIQDETRERIGNASRAKGKDESEIIRIALDRGLSLVYPKSSSTQALLDLAEQAANLPSESGEVQDVSTDLDHYAWGVQKRHDK